MMGVWDPGREKTVLSQIKKAIGARYQGFKGMTRVIVPGILIGFYFFIFFLLLSGCAYFQKEIPSMEDDPNAISTWDLSTVDPNREFICTKIDCGDEDIDKLVADEKNTIACIKLQPECKPNE